MADIHVHLDFTLSRRSARWWLMALLMAASATELSSESVTLTTYYPAPSGVYTQMITTGNTWIARDGGVVGIGTGTNTPSAKLEVDGDIVAVQSNGACAESQVTYADCNGGTTASICTAGQYATLTSGIIAKYTALPLPTRTATDPSFTSTCADNGYSVTFLCCPCASGTCPSL